MLAACGGNNPPRLFRYYATQQPVLVHFPSRGGRAPRRMKADAVLAVRGRELFTKAVQSHLDKVLTSEFFRPSARHQLLLRTIVSESLAGRIDALKEIVLARDVFGRPDYDPKRHTLVRVEVNAVRRKLA